MFFDPAEDVIGKLKEFLMFIAETRQGPKVAHKKYYSSVYYKDDDDRRKNYKDVDGESYVVGLYCGQHGWRNGRSCHLAQGRKEKITFLVLASW